MPLGGQTRMGPGNHVLDSAAHWRHLANKISWTYAMAAMRPVAAITVAVDAKYVAEKIRKKRLNVGK